MPLYAKAPKYFRERGFQTPLESNKGLFQYVEKSEESIWNLIAKNRDRVDDFQLHMAGRRAEQLKWIDWFPIQERIVEGFEDGEGSVLMVDVAGGRGHDLTEFHAKFPQTPGRLILEDMPQVLEGMTSSPGIECQPIDLFEPQPIKGDTPAPSRSSTISLRSSRCSSILYEVCLSRLGRSSMSADAATIADGYEEGLLEATY